MDISINKNSAYVLLQLLQGRDTAAKISEYIPGTNIRSIQRGLSRLAELGVAVRHGTNHPNYTVNYRALLHTNIANKLLENEQRPESAFNAGFISWLDSLSAKELDDTIAPGSLAAKPGTHREPPNRP